VSQTAPPISLTFYKTAPDPLDVVWCRWPARAAPGFKDRPALVNRILEDPNSPGHFAIEVCYGTSQIKAVRDVGSFVIQSYEDLVAIGLYKVTRFELLTTQLLPWAEEMFPAAPGRKGPIMGHFTNRQKVRLDVWSKATNNVIAALQATEDGDKKT
jgi:hypothetical protein